MDITKTSNKIYTTKLINSQTVDYTVINSALFLFFIILKQFFKLAFNIQASISVLISFIIAFSLSYFFEKKLVFIHDVKNSNAKQLPRLLFRFGVDFGFFKITQLVFSNLLEMESAFVYLITFLILLFFNFQFDKLVIFNTKFIDDGYQSKIYKNVFNNRYVIISALVTLCCLGVICLTRSTFPFGDATVLKMDLYHQYGPLFTEFYDRVIDHKSFLYSWTTGGGSSFLGNYFNYLSSPLSLIIFLFDRADMAYAVTTIVLTKCVLSSAAFTYYIKKSLNSHSCASASFGVLYSFCAYFLAYYWNLMWLDGMILLPLIVLGIERIIDTGKCNLYFVCMIVMFYSNYYIGFMMCIFAVLYYLCYFFSNHSVTEKINSEFNINDKNSLKYITNNYFIGRGLKFASSSVTAALIMACVLIPVYFILQSCSATSDTMPTSNETYFDIFNFISNHLAGLKTTIRSSGNDVLPNVYTGILPCLLLPAFYANSKISTKEKASYTFLLLFFFASFNNNFINYFWHAMHFPNDLPYRFSFMYSFILLIIAYKALINIRALKSKDYIFIGFGWLFFIMLCQKFDTEKLSPFSIYVSIAFVIIYSGLLVAIRNKRFDKLLASMLIITLTFGEVVVADNASLSFLSSNNKYKTNYSTYMDASNYIKENDDDFYRSELSYLNTRMDPCLYDYEGISVFSSMAYEKYSKTQYSLGMYGNRINSYTYNPQTPIYNMMYSLKYIVDIDKLNVSDKIYTKEYTTQDGCGTIYKNNYFLPIACTVSNDIKNWEANEGNPFEEQSKFIKSATGIEDIFVPVNYVNSENIMVDCDFISNNGTYFFEKVNKDSNDGTVEITISPKIDSNLYVYIHSPKAKNVDYVWDNENVTQHQDIEYPYIYDLGNKNTNEEIKISVDCGSAKEDSSYFEIYAYSIDLEKLDSAYDFLNKGAINVTNHNDTLIEGNINSGFNGTVYTSIPYDKGWSVYVDGEKVETISLTQSQLGFNISEGQHEIKFKYHVKGLFIGSCISATTIICLIVYNIIKKKRNLSKVNKNSQEDEINILS